MSLRAGEIISVMALPVLGGLLIADEVVDIFLPVRFYWVRRARWLKLQEQRDTEKRRANSVSPLVEPTPARSVLNTRSKEDANMRGTMMAMVAELLFLPALWAADKPAAPGEQLEAIKKEVEKSRTELNQAYEKAKTDKERQELQDKENKHRHACARRALELARKHPKDPVAVDALSWIIGGGLGWLGADAEIEAAFDLLRKDYITSDKLQRICFFAYIYDGASTKPELFLRTAVKKNPHREVQAHAYYYLARILRSQAALAKRLPNSAQTKKWLEVLNADVVKRIKASDPNKLLKEAEELFERVISKYDDVKTTSGRTFGEVAKAALFEMRHLVVGKVAPEIEGEDIDGKRFKLSDYRGKVVVLDFWGHW
jgi:hypothetical protein